MYNFLQPIHQFLKDLKFKIEIDEVLILVELFIQHLNREDNF